MAQNRDGTSGAINIFSTTPWSIAWLRQRWAFSRARMKQWSARALTGREPANITLKRINVLHTATWLRLGRFPRIPGAPREPFRHLLFCSNFSGQWDPYRQAFIDVIPGGIKSFWGPSVVFPPFPQPGTRYRLESWMYDRLPQSVYYYSAYPGVSPQDVRSAVRLLRELQAFALNPERDELRIRAFGQLQVRVGDCLGSSRPVVPGPAFGPPRATGMSNLVAVLPLQAGREDATLDRIAELPGGEDSPFRRVPGTHFARFAVLDKHSAGRHQRLQVELRSSWLLFTADFDGHFDEREARGRRMPTPEIVRYLDLVEQQPRLRDIWSDCVGFSSRRTLADLVEPAVLERFMLFRDHGDITLREVQTGLRLRDLYQQRLVDGSLERDGGIEDLLQEVRATVG